MLELNKYLKEIGINKKYLIFKERAKGKDKRFLKGKDGVIEAESFNLDETLNMIIYSYLCYSSCLF